MALQTTGPISLVDIATEFPDAAPHSMSEFYGAGTGVPTSGPLSASDFYGKVYGHSFTSWTNMLLGSSNEPWGMVAFDVNGVNYQIVGYGWNKQGWVSRSVNYGNFQDVNAGSGQYTYALAYGNGVVMGVCYTGKIIRSTDYGASWTVNSSVTGNTLQGIGYADGVWMITGTYGTIFKSTNDGLTWTNIGTTGLNDTHDGPTKVDGVWYVGARYGRIYRSTNEGASWQMVTNTGNSAHFMYGFCKIGNYIVAVGRASSNAELNFRSSDNGLTWTQFSTGLGLGGGQAVASNGVIAVIASWSSSGGAAPYLGKTSDGVNWSSLNLGYGSFWSSKQSLSVSNGVFYFAFENPSNIGSVVRSTS